MPRPAIRPSSGKAAIVGRQEREEAGRDAGGRQRERRACARAGVAQRLAQVRAFEPLGAVAHAELQTEVDPEADEQHREGNRDQVERPHHHEAKRGRDRQADGEIDRDREDDAVRSQCQP